jgi:hypothetical protein
VEKLTCCFSSSCGLNEFPLAMDVLAGGICPSDAVGIIIDSARCRSVEATELRRRRDRRNNLPRNAARTMAIARRDSSDQGSSGLSAGAKAGIAIAAVCGVAIIAVGVFLYLRQRRRTPRNARKNSSLETGNRQMSRQERQRQKQLDKEHKKEQEQLQQQLQQMQQQLQKEKQHEQEARQKQILKEQREQAEESKYVAELFELPGWMPERRTPVNELADTGHPRYEMITEANTAELGGGSPEIDIEEDHPYGHYPRRSRSYTAELSAAPGPNLPDDDEERMPLKRSQSDGGPIISPADHLAGRVLSPFDVSPPTATMPGLVFTKGDWRSGGGAQVPSSSVNAHPAIPLGLSLDAPSSRPATGKRSKGQGIGPRTPGGVTSEGRREVWA